MIVRNDKKVSKIYRGEETVQRIYKGTDKVYEYLPIGYRECKYIRTVAGGNYINTGFVPNDYGGNYTIVMDIQGVEIPSSNRYMCGTGSPRSCNIRVGTSGQINIYNQSISGSSAVTVVSLTATEADIINRNTFKVILRDEEATTLIKDGIEYSEENLSKTDSTNAYRIGQTTGTNGYDCKIYNWKFYDVNDNLVRNFIPCLDDNDVPCFYDSVTKDTYYNRGSGTFDYELL